MSFALKPGQKVPPLPGKTLFSDSSRDPWLKQTGFYIPPGVDLEKGVVNIVVWFHGFYVGGVEAVLTTDGAGVRGQLSSSGKNVVLVAPYLGLGGAGDKSTFSVKDLKGNWGERFLTQVLAALAGLRSSGEAVGIGRLFIACHSAGGQAMRAVVGTLGSFKGKLAECWGFDCLYTTGRDKEGPHPERDDANFWNKWLRGEDGRPLFIFFGKSTVPQSVKLNLLGRGLATDLGARRDPRDPQEVDKLTVRLGIDDPRIIDVLMGLQDLMPTTEPDKRPPPDPKFVQRAADNLLRKVDWPKTDKELMAMHYQIAKDHLLERLKGAGL